MTDHEPPIDEQLGEVLQALREHILWQRSCGASGIPASPTQQSDRNSVRSEPAPPRSHMPGAPTAPQSARMPEPQVHSQPAISAAPTPPQERSSALVRLADQTRACSRCPLHRQRTQAVFSRGSHLSEIVFVGEGPGADEDAQGEPFVGKAGQLLDRMIAAMGYGRDEVYICNIVKCRPPNNRTPEPEEIAACIPYLHGQLTLIAPRVIVALGSTAVQGLLGTTEGITRLRGKWKLYAGSIPVMPTFHPAYLLRREEAKRDVWNDLKLVLAQLGRSAPERKR